MAGIALATLLSAEVIRQYILAGSSNKAMFGNKCLVLNQTPGDGIVSIPLYTVFVQNPDKIYCSCLAVKIV